MNLSQVQLVLAAHGSTAHPDSNRGAFELADEIDRENIFRGVTPAFLDGKPEISKVLELLSPGPVVVVPLMTSQGYYFRQLPDRFAQNQNWNLFDIRFSSVLGVHERLAERIADRIKSNVQRFEIPVEATSVVVVGHGTRRNKKSCLTTIALTKSLRQLLNPDKFPFPAIKFAFIDQNPSLEQVKSSLVSPGTMIVPFLIGMGPHMCEDLPVAFGLKQNHDFPKFERDDAEFCFCDGPVIQVPGMAELCLDLAHRAFQTRFQETVS